VYLTKFCVPTSTVSGWSWLRSADDNQLVVPRTLTSTFGPRVFFTSGPAAWITSSSELRHPFIPLDSFRHSLGMYLYKSKAWFCITSGAFVTICLLIYVFKCLFIIIIIRLHQMHEMQSALTNVRGVCVSRSSSQLHCAKMAKQIKMLFGVNTPGAHKTC